MAKSTPPTQLFDLKAQAASTISDLIRRQRDISETEKILKSEKEELKSDVEAVFKRYKLGFRSVVTELGGPGICYYESRSVTISRDSLLELGVSPVIIQKATRETPYTAVKFLPPAGEK